MNSQNIFIAKSADVIGNVHIGNNSSIWYCAVLRGDLEPITIGEGSNVQDGCAVHVSPSIPTVIGNGVSIGHNCTIHGTTIKDNVLIGMGSILLDGSTIGENSIVGAGSLVTQNKAFPPNSLIMGSPAKVIRELTPDEIYGIEKNAEEYIEAMAKESGKSYYTDNKGCIVTR